jgi:transcriptional regulator
MTKQQLARQKKAIARDAADLRALELSDRGLSQRQVAAIVGCSQQHISNLTRAAAESE